MADESHPWQAERVVDHVDLVVVGDLAQRVRLAEVSVLQLHHVLSKGSIVADLMRRGIPGEQRGSEPIGVDHLLHLLQEVIRIPG